MQLAHATTYVDFEAITIVMVVKETVSPIATDGVA